MLIFLAFSALCSAHSPLHTTNTIPAKRSDCSNEILPNYFTSLLWDHLQYQVCDCYDQNDCNDYNDYNDDNNYKDYKDYNYYRDSDLVRAI